MVADRQSDAEIELKTERRVADLVSRGVIRPEYGESIRTIPAWVIAASVVLAFARLVGAALLVARSPWAAPIHGFALVLISAFAWWYAKRIGAR
ncbi:MAG: hypothetical protein AAF726_25045 [Planctomycetota bacterium]